MKNTYYRKKTFLAALAAAALASNAGATLIPLSIPPGNLVATAGAGLGSVNSLVTFQNTGSEVGAVGVNASGATVTGSSVAYFSGSLAAGATHEQTGAGNNTYTLAQLGTNTFSNVILIFNASEPQNAGAEPITLNSLSLNIFSPTGTLLGSFGTSGATTYPSLAGVGNAGYGYRLDTAQAAQANALIAANPNLRIGGAASASDASGGLETIFISTLNATPPGTGVPDSGSTIALLGVGLLSIAFGRRFLS